jgi:uncharacterized SAM-binding protein YcdF (DUF218 family)
LVLPKSRILRWAVPLALIAILALTHRLWLYGVGRFLVASEPPFKSDMVVVLAGDDHGNRVLKGAELVKEGWAPQVLVSGPMCCYGNRESDLAIAFAAHRGYPAAWFVALPIRGDSTRAEAREVVAELDRRGVKRFLLVTSNYHSRRASSIYRALVGGERFRVVPARDWAFRDEWWRTREGQKQVFFEWTKTVANWLGL